MQSLMGKWNGEMSYEQIGREDVIDAPRPDTTQRRSSWWGWAGAAEVEKDKIQ